MNNPEVISNLSVPYHYGNPTVAQVGIRDATMADRHYSVRKSFVNQMHLPVSIQERMGYSLSLPNMPQPGVGSHLLVRIEIEIHNVLREQLSRFLSALSETANGELKVLREAFNLRVKDMYHGGLTITLDYKLSYETLKSYGGSVYFKEIDTVISLQSIDSMPKHPASEENYHEQLLDRNKEMDHSFLYCVDIIDNNGVFGDKYIKINQQIYKVKARKSIDTKDGVYFNGNKPVVNKHDTTEPMTYRINYEDAPLHGLFDTYDGASMSSADNDRKIELTTLEHNLQVAKSEASAIKAAHDKEMFDKEAELKRMQIENDRLIESQKVEKQRIDQVEELRMLGIKNNYDAASYTRKDNSEAMKFLPTVIMGIGAAFLAFKKFF